MASTSPFDRRTSGAPRFEDVAAALGLPAERVRRAFDEVGGTPEEYYHFVIDGDAEERIDELARALGIRRVELSVALVESATMPSPAAPVVPAKPETPPTLETASNVSARPSEPILRAAEAGKEVVRDAAETVERLLDAAARTLSASRDLTRAIDRVAARARPLVQEASQAARDAAAAGEDAARATRSSVAEAGASVGALAKEASVAAEEASVRAQATAETLEGTVDRTVDSTMTVALRAVGDTLPSYLNATVATLVGTGIVLLALGLFALLAPDTFLAVLPYLLGVLFLGLAVLLLYLAARIWGATEDLRLVASMARRLRRRYAADRPVAPTLPQRGAATRAPPGTV